MKWPYLIIFPFLLTSCNLGGILTGFFYSYSTPDDRFESRETYSYHSDPELLKNISGADDKYTFSFAAISDIHMKEKTDKYMLDFFKDDLQTDDLFLLDCGDSVNNGEKEQLQVYKETMAQSGIPWFAAIGNHDIYSEGWKHYREIVGRSVYTLEAGVTGTEGSLFVIALDSANGTLGGRQLQWLESTLAEQKAFWDHIVVFTHCQFFSTGLNTVVQFSDTEEIYKLMNLFSTNGVDLVLMGHNHKWDERNIDGVQYLTLDPFIDRKSFVRVKINGDRLEWEKVPLNGN